MPTKKQLSETCRANNAEYREAAHKKLGTLHERMKWLIGCKEELREHIDTIGSDELFRLMQDLSVAVMDLETEVASTTSVKPALSSRILDGDELRNCGYVHRKNG